MAYAAPQKAYSGTPSAEPVKFEAVDIGDQSDDREGQNAHHLGTLERRFSDLAVEVGRITSALGGTTRQDGPQMPTNARLAEGDSNTVDHIKEIIKARRSRSNYFRGDLFADPAWDILLHLARAELEGQRVSVTGLCSAASVPPTTALRWITTLLDEGVLARRMDPLDARRKFVELTHSASVSMQQYFGRFAGCSAALI